jgi:glycosyltransferase involved in cell wall biosynthesis
MATGLPVVSTNVGGTPELITHGDNGFLAKPGCIEELASHLLAYLQDPGLRKEHGLQNRKVTNERFSIQAMVQGYEQVWRRVAGKR